MSDTLGKPRKKPPKQLAVIDADVCTGCGACIEVCSVGCIVKIEQHSDRPGLQAWCEVDWDRCIGCGLCIRVAGKKSDPYTLWICPRGAMQMVPLERIVEAVDSVGGPPQWAEANRRRLLAAAHRQVNPSDQVRT